MHEASKSSWLPRRALLAGATAVAAWLCLPILPAKAATGFERFMEISEELTGMTDLDPAIGQAIYALLDMARRIETLSGPSGEDAAAAAREGLEVEVISAWYSGIVETNEGPRLAAYQDALMWEALDFTKPMGECSSGFGSWAEAAWG